MIVDRYSIRFPIILKFFTHCMLCARFQAGYTENMFPGEIILQHVSSEGLILR